MGRLFYGNFDFENQLAGAERASATAAVRRMSASLAAAWVAVAADGDAVWTPARPEPEFGPHLRGAGLAAVGFQANLDAIPPGSELVPWGWTDQCRRTAKRRGWTDSGPPQDAVRAVNARSFSAGCERECGVGLEGAAVIRRLDELRAALRRLPGPATGWVIKAEYGMSARERVIGRGVDVAEPQSRWVAKRLAADGVVHLEPWVRRVDEAGLQFTIHSDGTFCLEGITPLLCAPGGEYRGSLFGAIRDDSWESAIEIASRAVRRIAESGYFGPVGIDAMRYLTADGRLRVRPIQDINARWTMGRLSLGFRRLLPGEGTGAWLHLGASEFAGRSPESVVSVARDLAPPETVVLRTSPMTLGGVPNDRLSLLLLSPSGRDLRAAAERPIGSADTRIGRE